MNRLKVRIRFRKAGDLRFVSHHDLLRLFERMLRRADLPFRSTEGFHPKPKMAFASALGLGIVGQQEVVEIEFDDSAWSSDSQNPVSVPRVGRLEALEPGAGVSEGGQPVPPDQLTLEQIRDRLVAQAPPGLEILSLTRIEPKRNAQVRRAAYALPLDARAYPDLPQRIADLLAQEECWVQRTKPQPRRVNLRPYLLGIDVQEHRLVINIAVTPNGSARPEEVLQVLGLGELLANGAVLERTVLELHDESVGSGQWAVGSSPSVTSGNEEHAVSVHVPHAGTLGLPTTAH